MKTLPLTARLNMKFGEVEGAYKMRDGDVESAICAVTYGNNADPEYFSAIDLLADFYSAANEETGFTVSVWLD